MSIVREDIELNGTLLPIYLQGAQETGIPKLAGEGFNWQEEPAPIETWHLGAFYSMPVNFTGVQSYAPSHAGGGVYAYADNGDGRHPRLFCPGPAMNSVTLTGATDHARAAADYSGDLYIGAGRYIQKVASGTGAVTQDRDTGVNNVVWSMVPFNGDLCAGIANGSTSSSTPGLLQVKTGGAWSASASSLAKHLTKVFYNTDFRLVASNGMSTISHLATGPLTPANWAASITIGDTTYGINRLLVGSSSRHLYIAKTNGLHDLDGSSGVTPNVMPMFQHVIDDENGIAGHGFGAHVYTSHMQGLFRFQATGQNSGFIECVTPGYGTGNETPIRGRITASISQAGWQVVAVWNGTDTYICYGRERHEGEPALGPSPMLWHGGLIKLSALKCYLLHISGLTDPPRLWVGAGSAGAGYNAQWCVLPRADNPLQDTEYRFATSYSLYLTPQDLARPATRKNLVQLDVEGDNLGAGASAAFYTNAEGGAYSLFGTANTSPQSTLVPTADFLSRRAGYRVDGSGTGTAAAILRSILPQYAVRVAIRQVRVYEVLLSEGHTDRYGGREMSLPQKRWETLRTLANNAGRVTLRDEFGVQSDVLVQGPVERRLVEKKTEGPKGARESVLVATVRCTVLRTSAVGNTFNWNDGTVFDAGKVYG